MRTIKKDTPSFESIRNETWLIALQTRRERQTHPAPEVDAWLTKLGDEIDWGIDADVEDIAASLVG